MRLAKVGILCLSAFTFFALEHDAQACSFTVNVSRAVFPPSGTEGVPTNAEIRLSYFNALPIGDPSVLVRPVGGQPITLDIRDHERGEFPSVRLVLAKPTEELLANTAYEVLDRVVVGCRPSAAGSGADCLRPDHAVVATFVTGATKDQTPPSFSGVKVPKIENKVVCDDSSCCGPYSAVPIILDWDSAADDHSPDLVRYNVYRSPTGTTPPVQPIARFLTDFPFRGGLVCSGSPQQGGHGSPGLGMTIDPGMYAVRAVDSAGNEEQNTTEVEVPAACAGGEVPSESAGGCTMSRPPKSKSVSIFLLAAGLLLARYARRSR